MSNVVPIIMSVFGGGAVTGAVSAGRWVMDERARRHAEKLASDEAPLKQQSLELRNAALADELLKDTIKVLRQNYAELKADFAQYRREAEAQRQRDLQEHQRQRQLDLDELSRARVQIGELHQEIEDQNATISQLKFQLQAHNSGPGL